jgi:hypothetical protein
LIGLIKQEIVDVGFGYGPISEYGVAIEPLFQTQLVCFVPEHHSLAHRSVLRAKDLAGSTIIALRPSTSIGIMLHEELEKQKVKNIRLSVDELGLDCRRLCSSRHRYRLGRCDGAVRRWQTRRQDYSIRTENSVDSSGGLFASSAGIRGLARFITHVRTTLHEICDDLHANGLPGEVI